jgi:hypothetical protein
MKITLSNPLCLQIGQLILSLEEFSFQIKEGSICIMPHIRYRQLEQTKLTAGKCNQKKLLAILALL